MKNKKAQHTLEQFREMEQQPWANQIIFNFFLWYRPHEAKQEINNLVKEALPKLNKKEQQSLIFFKRRLNELMEAVYLVGKS